MQDSNIYDVAIILVNYNSSQYTLSCIESIKSTTSDNINYAIMIVDNSSQLEDYNHLKNGLPNYSTQHPTLLMRSKINIGFSAGNMLGVKNIEAKYYFFLNNDCELKNDCVSILHNFCESNKNTALCSPQLIDKNNHPQPCINYFPTLRTKILGTQILSITNTNRHARRKEIYDRPVRVDVVSGSQMFVRAKSFFEIGGFDTTFFLYCEEEDIALRLHNAGYDTYLVPDALNYHVGGGSTEKAISIKKEFYISFLYFYKKHYGAFRTTILKVILSLRLLRKAIQNSENYNLALFVATRADLKHSLRYAQKSKPH